jgi:LacI family transcriptional regulator
MVTSVDVARDAGVSQATVSRVLNKDRSVSPETRQRVLAAIERLGYRPNAIARGLVTSRSELVGVIVSDITNPFYPELLEAISERLAQLGLKMVLYNAWGQEEGAFIRLLLEQRVDGIIFTSALLDSGLVRQLADRGFPIVLANRYVDGVRCDAVSTENESGAQLVAGHLLEFGHRRIAVVAGHAKASTSRDRVRGFRAALRSAGVKLPRELLVRGEFRFDRAYEGTRQLLQLDAPPTAVFCVNDLMAFAALSAARHEGVGVPDELSIVGFDAIPMSSWDVFRLTTVRQPLGDMARASVDLLVNRIADPTRPYERIVFPSELILGDTSSPAALR